jgi:hypothetical protein
MAYNPASEHTGSTFLHYLASLYSSTLRSFDNQENPGQGLWPCSFANPAHYSKNGSADIWEFGINKGAAHASEVIH